MADKKAGIGTDWIYIGLGIGAIYAVYKLTKPTTDLANSIAGSASGITNAAGGLGTDTVNFFDKQIKLLSDAEQWAIDQAKRMADLLGNIHLGGTSGGVTTPQQPTPTADYSSLQPVAKAMNLTIPQAVTANLALPLTTGYNANGTVAPMIDWTKSVTGSSFGTVQNLNVPQYNTASVMFSNPNPIPPATANVPAGQKGITTSTPVVTVPTGGNITTVGKSLFKSGAGNTTIQTAKVGGTNNPWGYLASTHN